MKVSLQNQGLTQWLFLVPLKGGRYHINHQKAIYKWYTLPIGGWTMPPIPPFRGTTNNIHWLTRHPSKTLVAKTAYSLDPSNFHLSQEGYEFARHVRRQHQIYGIAGFKMHSCFTIIFTMFTGNFMTSAKHLGRKFWFENLIRGPIRKNESHWIMYPKIGVKTKNLG